MKKLTQAQAEDQFLKRDLVLLSEYKRRRSKVTAKCLCGNIFQTSPNSVFYRESVSCGCVQRAKASKRRKADITNQKFGKLLAIKNTEEKDRFGNYYWKCLCDCGQYCRVKLCHLRSGNTKTCGECGFYHNGVATSSCVIEICSWFPGCSHNHNILWGKKNINVDVCLVKEKTVIEYDEWYWHRHNLDRDIGKSDLLLAYGWSVIRIKARRNMPNKQELLSLVLQVSNNNIYREIVLLPLHLI